MLNLFSELSRSSCYTAHSFSNELQCSVIFHCYSAQSFANDYNELSHFCYSAQSFYGFVSHSRDSVTHFATVLSHFIILSTILKILLVILAQCSVILQNCSVIPEFQSFFKMTDVGSRGGRQLTTQLEWLAGVQGRTGPSRVGGVSRDRGGHTGMCAVVPSSIGSVGLVDCWIQVMDLRFITLGDE
jgi:hypothetical protein